VIILALDQNTVKTYVEEYITLEEEHFTLVYNDCMEEYNDECTTYGIDVDNNYLMALIMLIRLEGVLKVRNAKSFMNLLSDFENNKKKVLSKYASKFSYVISE
jgi:hypothetical protein